MIRTATSFFAALSTGCFIVLLCSCSQIGPLSGDVVDNPNKVVGKVVSSLGNPVDGAVIRLRPDDYAAGSDPDVKNNVPFCKDAVTDQSGTYSFSDVPPGLYTIEAIDLQGNGAVSKCPVADRSSAVDAGTNTLDRVAIVRGIIPSERRANNEWIVQILGLERWTTADSMSGAFIFYDIPKGTYSVRQISNTPRALPVSINNLLVPAGAAVAVPDAAWKYSRHLFLNTTSTGAHVAANVLEFPLLVSLTDINFNFSQTKASGDDLRFTKIDGTPLAFEIERWNSELRQAEIWVKLDTVYGNSNSQSVTMLWGNPGAARESSGAAVFAGTEGYRGVWHMADNGASSTVADAVGLFNGTMMSESGAISTATVSYAGAVGQAIDFQGGGTVRHRVNLGTDKPFVNGLNAITVSLWLNSDRNNFSSTELFSFSKAGPLSVDRPASRLVLGFVESTFQFKATPRDTIPAHALLSAGTFAIQTWYYLSGVADFAKDSMYLYVNGELWGSQKVSFGTTAVDMTNSASGTIGANDLGIDEFFNGRLDEVRVEGRARSADWIRLNYENQRKNGLLVQF